MRDFLSFLALFALFSGIYGYKKYTDPLKIMTPDENNVYAYDMKVAKKLTMSYNNDNPAKHATPVDYDYKTSPPTAAGLASIKCKGAPGAPIVVPYMSEVWIRVTNAILMDSMTIHVHGIDKHGMWFMDGVAFVQQCPIQSTNRFEYRFIADNKGTHWYHGHMQTDRGDGIAGGFIVVDVNDTTVPTLDDRKRVKPNREYFILMQDWATKVGEEAWMQLEDKTMKWMYGYDDFTKCWEPTRTSDGGNVGGAVPISAILLNNKGWFDHDVVKSQPFNLPLERFKILPNEDVLFRIVNGGVAQELMLYVEGHPMTVVAADGDEVVPMQVDRLIIFPGERYDILIKGLATPTKKSYRIQVETIQRYFFDWKEIPIVYGFGYIEYETQGLTEDKTTPNLLHPECTSTKKCTVLNCPFQTWTAQPNFTCIAYDNLQNPLLEDIEPEILQATTFNGGFEEHFINMHHDSQMDQYLFQFPWGIPYYHNDDMSTISTACSDTACANHPESDLDTTCRCFYNLEHKLGNVVQITLYNMGLGGAMGTGYAHPFHLHGHHFYVMKVGWPTYNASGFIDQMNPDIDCPVPTVSCNGDKWRNNDWMGGALEGMNTKNPTERDTITLPIPCQEPGLVVRSLSFGAAFDGRYRICVGEHNEIYMPPDNFPKDCGVFKVDKLPELRLPTDNSTVTLSKTFIAICLVLLIDRLF
ncbi:hypothetical protein CAEBREN_28408 [Caenorhabditis brenneri]|uniref:Uncharacterized protein n=1 Tax=Caenorhabditis brenneri TaxID=135651 RepID=G0PG64_CAEBE|nr:hypothetical protein CAEBREN_28408 [Caenorhabditis brenneri]